MTTKNLVLTIITFAALLLALLAIWGTAIEGAAIAAVILLAGLLLVIWGKAVLVAVVFALIILIAPAAPALAQDVEPLTATVPGDAGQYVDLVGSGVLWIILALLALLGGAIVALMQSAPPWTRQLVAGLVTEILKQAKNYTDDTETTLDDAGLKALIEQLIRLGVIPEQETGSPWLSPGTDDPNARG